MVCRCVDVWARGWTRQVSGGVCVVYACGVCVWWDGVVGRCGVAVWCGCVVGRCGGTVWWDGVVGR